MTRLIACHYSLAGAAPPALPRWSFAARVAAAANAGFDAIGLGGWDYASMRKEGVDPAELLRVLDEHEIRVDEVELLSGWISDSSRDERARVRQASIWEMVEVFRPHHLIVGDSTLASGPIAVNEAAARFAELCDRAAEFDVLVGIEFVPGTAFPNALHAAEVARCAERPNGGVLVDVYHHVRGGAGADELAAVADRVVGIQLGDHGPAVGGVSHFDGWRYGGLPPGEGEFDLVGLIRTLDDHHVDVPLSVEVLSPALASAGVDQLAWRLASATRSVIARSRGSRS